VSRERLGIFGGTFDPPHVAHLAVAQAALEQARLARVVLVPAAAAPMRRQRGGASPEHRLEMARLAARNNPFFSVSDEEVRRGGTSYTVDTLRAMAAREPEAALHLIIGGDQLAAFPRWREPREIARLARLVVYRREGFSAEVPEWLAERVTFVEAPRIELSATEIRALIGRGRSARYLLPEAVRSYIVEHGLYRQPGPTTLPAESAA
jgi:nicotinate-nucleotide adenylyltransferase